MFSKNISGQSGKEKKEKLLMFPGPYRRLTRCWFARIAKCLPESVIVLTTIKNLDFAKNAKHQFKLKVINQKPKQNKE